jgi:hypothetical protein
LILNRRVALLATLVCFGACAHQPVGQLTLHVLGPAGLKSHDFSMTLTDSKAKLAPESVTPAAKVRKTSIVLLVQANAGFMDAAHDSIKDALTPLAGLAGDDAQVALITYAATVETKLEFVSAKEFMSATIGDSSEYADEDIDLLEGLLQSIKLLEGTSGGRRILIVLGDGSNTKNHPDNTPDTIMRHFDELGIEVYSIDVPVDDNEDNETRMKLLGEHGNYFDATVDDVATTGQQVALDVKSSYVVTFKDLALPLDGKDHDATLHVKDKDEDFTYQLAAPRPGQATVESVVPKLIITEEPSADPGEGGDI